MKVLYVRPSRSRGYTVIGLISASHDKENYTVPDAVVSEYNISLGEQTDEDTYLEIKAQDEIFRAKRKALSILAYGDNSRRMLYTKLIRSGFSRELSQRTVDEMCAYGYINERERLARLITDEVNIHFTGRAKILAKLTAKGYSRRDIEDTISELSSNGEIDFSEARQRLIEKYLPDGATDEQIKKLLYKNGHGVC